MNLNKKNDNYTKGTGIKIEPVFDYMLNSKPSYSYEGGIILPTEDNAGTGNIVIKGRPGTGKSTLAMQIAVATTEKRCDGNMFYSVYFTFEEKISHMMSKAELFGWRNQIKELIHMQDLEMNPQPDKLAKSLKKILTQDEAVCKHCMKSNLNERDKHKKDKDELEGYYHECKSENCGDIQKCKNIESKVLLPILSPRSIHKKTDSEQENLFWKRYSQIESFLKAAREIKEDNINSEKNISDLRKYPELAVVCIDSLNVFGDKELSREELYRLFDLFKRYQVIGVMIYEEELSDENILKDFSQMRNTIEYMADVVISLKVGQDKGYSNRYIEIEKSRYQKQIRGMHPYSIKALERTKEYRDDFLEKSGEYLELFNACKILKKTIIKDCMSQKNKDRSEVIDSEFDSEIIDYMRSLRLSKITGKSLNKTNDSKNEEKDSDKIEEEKVKKFTVTEIYSIINDLNQMIGDLSSDKKRFIAIKTITFINDLNQMIDDLSSDIMKSAVAGMRTFIKELYQIIVNLTSDKKECAVTEMIISINDLNQRIGDLASNKKEFAVSEMKSFIKNFNQRIDILISDKKGFAVTEMKSSINNFNQSIDKLISDKKGFAVTEMKSFINNFNQSIDKLISDKEEFAVREMKCYINDLNQRIDDLVSNKKGFTVTEMKHLINDSNKSMDDLASDKKGFTYTEMKPFINYLNQRIDYLISDIFEFNVTEMKSSKNDLNKRIGDLTSDIECTEMKLFHQLFKKYTSLRNRCENSNKRCDPGCESCLLTFFWSIDDIFSIISGKYYDLKDDQLVSKSPFVIFPSLQSSYYELLKSPFDTMSDQDNNKTGMTKDEYAKGLGVESLKYLLSDGLTDKHIIFILGERNTYKTTLTRNLIFYSLLDDADIQGPDTENPKKGENVVLIKFQDYEIVGRNIKISKDVEEILKNYKDKNGNVNCGFKKIANPRADKERYPLLGILDNSRILKLNNDKVKINFYHISIKDKEPKNDEKKACLMEIEVFDKSISSEELMVLISSILTAPELNDGEKTRIDRFILHDINHIGISFPLLVSSKTSNDLFLSSVTKLMRKYDVKLLMTATNGTNLKTSNDLISNAFAVSDSVFICKHIEVFGSIYATIFSENIMTGDRSNNEIVPGVITYENGSFDVDFNILRGLVGFETGKVYRPDLNIILSKGNKYFKDYIKEITQMLEFGLAESMKRKVVMQRKDSSINVIEVDNIGSEALYEAISFNEGGPVNKTVLYSVDEFYLADKKDTDISKVMVNLEGYGRFGASTQDSVTKSKSIKEILKKKYYILNKDTNKDTNKDEIYNYLVPFYTNALYLLIDKEGYKKRPKKYKSLTSWKSIYEVIKDDNDKTEYISFNHISKETISCVFIDLILSTFLRYKDNKDRDEKILDLKELIDLLEDFIGKNEKGIKKEDIYADFEAFHKVFSGFFKKTFNHKEDENNNECRNSRSPLKLVWHSHLREIFDSKEVDNRITGPDSKEPDNIDNYKVIPLPGGGFVGDWFIGILKGSTNIHQGIRVIETICNEVEDYKRYTIGVGLPVRKKFYKPEYPIISSQITDVSLNNILDSVYNKANRRSEIENYGAVREVMYEICCRYLMYDISSDENKRMEDLKDYVITPLITMLGAFI